jgi:transposase-like protein
MLDERTGQFRLEVCPNNNRSSAALIPLIKKNIADGSVIMTDCWPSYNPLNVNGYNHLKVNHSINFVNRQTLANTQKIECNWCHMETALTIGGKNHELITQYLCEYIWRRHYRKVGADMFIQFRNYI